MTVHPLQPLPLSRNRRFHVSVLLLVGAVLAMLIAPVPDTMRPFPTETGPSVQMNAPAFYDNLTSGTHLVDFWASWCAPCRAQDPIIQSVADSFAGKVKVWKVDVDVNKDITDKFGVSTVPTLFVIHNGQVMHRFNGLQSEQELVDVLSGIVR